MLTLVYGGAASGKSEFAESLALQAPEGKRIYLATMLIDGGEAKRRVSRHVLMREGKGFVTVEQPRNIHLVKLTGHPTVLLECLPNLAANECFGGVGALRAAEHILTGLTSLLSQSDVIAVAGSLTSDGIVYSPETEAYLACLNAVQCAAAARADAVYEVVCSIPVRIR